MHLNMHLRISLITAFLFFIGVLDAQFQTEKEQHEIKQLNRAQIQYISQLADVNNFFEILNEILIPRVVGTPGHLMVQNAIKARLKQYGFHVEIDEFIDKTPTHGVLTFRNIIGTLNPSAERFLVFACHYDSKYFANEEFLGATDSAVPCAMMLNLIKTMQHLLELIKDNRVSLMLLFLDGEEAFHTWSSTDSIYGARNLAEKWGTQQMRTDGGELLLSLDRIDLFVLLDLLGTPNPTFYSYFRKTDRHYLTLSRAEKSLAKLNLLQSHNRKYFQERALSTGVEDDHIPFMRRGVPILHVIPTPFPKVWHKIQDNRNAIDEDTVENFNKIFRVFVAEYLHIPLNNDQMDEDDEYMDSSVREDL